MRASCGSGPKIPGLAKLPQLRQQELVETEELALAAPGKKLAFEKRPFRSHRFRLQFAPIFIVEVGGDRTGDRHGWFFNLAFHFPRFHFGPGPTACVCAETDEAAVFENASYPLGAVAAAVVKVMMRAGRVVTGIDRKHGKLLRPIPASIK